MLPYIAYMDPMGYKHVARIYHNAQNHLWAPVFRFYVKFEHKLTRCNQNGVGKFLVVPWLPFNRERVIVYEFQI